MSGLLDLFTGGKDEEAQSHLSAALANLSNVPTPTVQQLTLPELQRYVQAGMMTPAQAQAYLQNNNAYDQAKFDPSSWAAQISALNQLADVANAGPNGTPIERAQQAQAEQNANRSLAGNIGAIEQQAEARGVPPGLLQAALETQAAGQAAQTQNQADLQAQAQAYQAALNAMAQEGSLGGQMQGEQQNWQQAVANAANTMQQFNAQNQTAVSEANAGRQQQANAANFENAQNLANMNTQNANARTAYNARLPQQVFENQFNKATAQAGIGQNQANLSQQQGQQEAGIWSGLIGAGAGIAGNYALGQALQPLAAKSGVPEGSVPGIGPISGPADPSQYAPRGYADGGVVSPYPEYMAHGGMVDHTRCYHDGGICMADGDIVPGQPNVPGDSLENDTVPIMASPGEAVIPRSTVAANPDTVLGLLSQGPADIDPHDVATIMKAMQELRSVA